MYLIYRRGSPYAGGPCVCLHVRCRHWRIILGKEGVSLVRAGIALVVIAPPVIAALAMMSRQIITPTKLMAEAATELRLAIWNCVSKSRARMIGRHGRCLSTHDRLLAGMADSADRLAQGNVTTDISPQSAKDVLGNAFQRMIGYQQGMAQAAERLARATDGRGHSQSEKICWGMPSGK